MNDNNGAGDSVVDSPPTAENETAAGMTAGAGGVTEFMPEAIRKVETPAAWSHADEPDDIKPAHASWRAWWLPIGGAAAIVLVAGAVAAWIVLAGRTDPQRHQPPPSSAASSPGAAKPAPPPEAARPPREEQINDAFIENIGGQTILAFTMEVPGLRILGSPQQWDDVTNKLRALGIEIRTDDAGYVTGVTFDNEDAKRNWQKWYARLKPTDQTQTADKNYIYFLQYNGVRIDDRVAMIKLGHQQCVFLAQPGNTVALAEVAIHNQYPQFSPDKAFEIVDAAVAAYCPGMRTWE